MDLENPRTLWLLLALPPLALWAWRSAGLRGRGWRALGQWGRPPGDRSVAVLIAWTLIVLALSRPRIGREPADAIGPGQDVVLAFDVSRSMAAEDAAPSRLGLAVETARTLVDELAREPANRAAVVAFAGRGALRCPLTENLGAAVDAMERLRPGEIRPGGTDLGAALDAAVDAFDPREPNAGRTVVVFSDGEDHEGRWERALEKAVARGVIVHAIALGDVNEGARVPSPDPDEPLTYRGEPVVSRRSDEALATIAERSGGAMLRLGLATTDLGLLYRERIEPVARAKRREARGSGRPERFPAFLAGAIGVLILASRPGDRARRPRRLPRAVAGAACLALALAQVAADDAPETAAQAVARGCAAYADGRFEEALRAFETAAALAPDRAVPAYDAGAALYQLGRHAEAVARYQEAREHAGPALRAKIDFAIGNAAVGLGDLPGAVRSYDACLASTARGEGPDAVRADAAENRRFVLERLQAATAERDEPDDSGGDEDRPDGTKSRGDATPEDAPGDGPDGRPPDSPGEGEPTDRPSPRQSGGAGGDAPAPPGASPDDRLDAALDQIRDARRRRLPDQPPPESPRGDGKDW
ncbi:VWA domain-containing protein [Paludisphaera sp.]|uniref:vWA domain-containing protein n=1 Tax=Paludisphaera sp. TaxID=2017432 RepID=UPI00301D0AF0